MTVAALARAHACRGLLVVCAQPALSVANLALLICSADAALLALGLRNKLLSRVDARGGDAV
eukprot:COSAG01_NODE_27452_length_685_cov_1.494881_2_plen_61_part_01